MITHDYVIARLEKQLAEGRDCQKQLESENARLRDDLGCAQNDCADYADLVKSLRSQISALREALAKLNKGMTDYFAENPNSAWCVVAREGAEELAAALASTEPGKPAVQP